MPASFSAVIIASTSWRSMTGLPQAVVALTVGDRLVTKLQTLGRRDLRRRRRLALPGEDVEHDVGAAGAALEGSVANLT